MATNIAPDGTATADSEYGGAYSADHMNDLNTNCSDRWLSDAGLPHWAQIEWVSEKYITEVGFYCSSGGGEQFSEYYIEYWDGGDWVEVAHVSGYSDTCPTRTSHVTDFITTKVRMRFVAGNIYSGLTELELIGEEPPSFEFIFSDPSPAHQSIVYGSSQTLQLTVTISGVDTYDADFYDATTSGIIGSTISGTQSGQPVSSIPWSTIEIGSYSWYVTVTASGEDATSSGYDFTKKFQCAGTITEGETGLSGIPVRLYKRDTGELVGSTTSAGISGTFEIDTIYNEYHYAVALYASTISGVDPTETNALIYDWLIPTVS